MRDADACGLTYVRAPTEVKVEGVDKVDVYPVFGFHLISGVMCMQPLHSCVCRGGDFHRLTGIERGLESPSNVRFLSRNGKDFLGRAVLDSNMFQASRWQMRLPTS